MKIGSKVKYAKNVYGDDITSEIPIGAVGTLMRKDETHELTHGVMFDGILEWFDADELELVIDDTITDIRNHISPNTVVIEK